MANDPTSAARPSRAAPFSMLTLAVVGVLALGVGQDLLLATDAHPAARRLWVNDMAREGGLPGWLNAGVLAAVAVSLIEVGRRERRAGDEFAWHWLLLGGGFAVMAVDEVFRLHAPVLAFAAPALRFDWPPSLAAYLLAGGLAMLAATYARFLQAMPASIRMLMMLAAGLAVADLAIADRLRAAGEQDAALFRAAATVEETLELVAAAVMLYAVSLCRRLQQADPLRG